MIKIFKAFFFLCFATASFAQNPTSILQKAEAKLAAADLAAEVSIRTVRPRWERTMEAKIWNEGLDKTLILITGPAREKGTVFLRNGDDVWHFVPGSRKIVALPAAMIQSWMGTDFTNDALINAGSLVADYEHTLIGITPINGTNCFKIKLEPKTEAAVVWGQVIAYVSVDEFLQLRTEFYDEEAYLITTLEAMEVASFGEIRLPSKLKITPAEDEGNFTELTYKALDFNPIFPEGFFERSNMKAVK